MREVLLLTLNLGLLLKIGEIGLGTLDAKGSHNRIFRKLHEIEGVYFWFRSLIKTNNGARK